MTPERKELIDKFQKFFDTEPTRNIIAAVCANIAEEYASQLTKLKENQTFLVGVIQGHQALKDEQKGKKK